MDVRLILMFDLVLIIKHLKMRRGANIAETKSLAREPPDPPPSTVAAIVECRVVHREDKTRSTYRSCCVHDTNHTVSVGRREGRKEGGKERDGRREGWR